ncbi:MAG TPA: nuclear transport factor 2 family protein [Jatrophihabitans sp.]|nr:nuclear transport factor 2 family protein [Jatrophihabitans sp.]
MLRLDLKGLPEEMERELQLIKPDEAVLADPVAAQVDAYNAHDLTRFLSCFDKDVVFEDGTGQKLFSGHGELSRVYAGVFGTESLSCEVVNRIQLNQWVVDEQKVTGLAGDQAEETVIVVYQVANGLISRVRLLR